MYCDRAPDYLVEDQPAVSSNSCKPLIKMVQEDKSSVGIPSDVIEIELRRLFMKRGKTQKGLIETPKPKKANDAIKPYAEHIKNEEDVATIFQQQLEAKRAAITPEAKRKSSVSRPMTPASDNLTAKSKVTNETGA